MTHASPAADVEHKYAVPCLQAEESNPHAWYSYYSFSQLFTHIF